MDRSIRQQIAWGTLQRNIDVCWLKYHGRRQVDIARWFGVSKQCINQLLEKYYEDYVKRYETAPDRRRGYRSGLKLVWYYLKELRRKIQYWIYRK